MSGVTRADAWTAVVRWCEHAVVLEYQVRFAQGDSRALVQGALDDAVASARDWAAVAVEKTLEEEEEGT